MYINVFMAYTDQLQECLLNRFHGEQIDLLVVLLLAKITKSCVSTCCHTRNKPHQCRLGSRLRAPFLGDLCSVVFAPHLCVIAVLMYAGEPIFQVWHFCFIISTSNYWPILLFTLVSRIILWACLLRDENIQCDKDLATKEEKNSSSFEGTATMPLPLRDRSDCCMWPLHHQQAFADNSRNKDLADGRSGLWLYCSITAWHWSNPTGAIHKDTALFTMQGYVAK